MTDDIAARLSAMPEDRTLDCFWMMHRGGADPLELLKQFLNVRVWRPKGWDTKTVRRNYLPPKWSKDTRCFGCSSGHPHQSHHVIQIQHGGSNDRRNLVAVCFNCHQRLHPWLEEQPSRRGLEWLRHIIPRALDRFIGRRTA